jgi:hypothetical protein
MRKGSLQDLTIVAPITWTYYLHMTCGLNCGISYTFTAMPHCSVKKKGDEFVSQSGSLSVKSWQISKDRDQRPPRCTLLKTFLILSLNPTRVLVLHEWIHVACTAAKSISISSNLALMYKTLITELLSLSSIQWT